MSVASFLRFSLQCPLGAIWRFVGPMSALSGSRPYPFRKSRPTYPFSVSSTYHPSSPHSSSSDSPPCSLRSTSSVPLPSLRSTLPVHSTSSSSVPSASSISSTSSVPPASSDSSTSSTSQFSISPIYSVYSQVPMSSAASELVALTSPIAVNIYRPVLDLRISMVTMSTIFSRNGVIFVTTMAAKTHSNALDFPHTAKKISGTILNYLLGTLLRTGRHSVLVWRICIGNMINRRTLLLSSINSSKKRRTWT